jgi:hypothetical protein
MHHPPRLRGDPFELTVALLAALYCLAALSPSSYGQVLRGLGVADDGVLLFEPRGVRSDESALVTPMFQTAVRTGYTQVNTSSIYGETQRHLISLPLRDWGMLFKPLFWGFLLPRSTAPWAFSAYFAGLYALFLIGYYRLFRMLGQPAALAAGATLLLFFSAYAQAWWTSLGQHLALAPWILILFLSETRPGWRFLLNVWLGGIFLIGLTFYPPLLVNLGLPLALGCWLLKPETLRLLRDRPRLLSTVAGLAVACVFAWLYLREPLALALSSNHGARNEGGGGVLWQVYLGLFLPLFPSEGPNLWVGPNYCEASTGGSYLTLLILAFVDWRALRESWREKKLGEPIRKWVPTVTLGALFLAMSLWMLLPIPAAVGAPLLWNKFPATRLLFPAGLALCLLALAWLPRFSWRFTLGRLLACAAVVVAAWWPSRHLSSILEARSLGALWRAGVSEARHHWNGDLYVLGLLLLLPLGAALWRWRHPESAPRTMISPTILVFVAAAANALAFADFNPLMSTRPIFERQDSPRLRSLQAMQDAHPEKILVTGSWAVLGGVLNGYGFRAANHFFVVPHAAYWRKKFPDLDEGRFRSFFQRYHILQVDSFAPPTYRDRLKAPVFLGGDLTVIPVETFLPPTPVTLTTAEWPPLGLAQQGEIRQLMARDGRIDLSLVGEINGFTGKSTIKVYLDGPATIREQWLRPRENRFDLDAGIRLYSRLDLQLDSTATALCVVTQDPDLGTYAIPPPPNSPIRSLCP